MDQVYIYVIVVIVSFIVFYIAAKAYDNSNDRKTDIKNIEVQLWELRDKKLSKAEHDAAIALLNGTCNKLFNYIKYIAEKSDIDIGDIELDIFTTKHKYL